VLKVFVGIRDEVTMELTKLHNGELQLILLGHSN
jgi:hypothetical protein